jgi:hypothetical protein
MKSHVLLLSLFASATFVNGQQSSAPPPVNITVQSEAKDLARGYAKASTELSRPPVTLALQKDGVVRVLEDVRQVHDSEGVLVVEVGKGIIYLINPKDVLYITDGYQIAPAGVKTK